MKKNLIKKSLSRSSRVFSYALDPLKQTIRGLKHHVESSNLSLNNLVSQNTRQLEDISALQESMRVTMVTLLDRSATIITALCCISVAFAVLLFITLFV